MSNCENIRIGREFLISQSWPNTLQNAVYDRCYCSQCYLNSYHDTYKVGGRTYVIPRGWTRFGVHVDEPFANHHNVWNTWVNCYHGTSIECAKSIVEHRQLLLPRDTTMTGKRLQIREGHIPGEYYFFTTPSINYASQDCYSCMYEFRSTTTNQLYNIRVALQCKQKPDSFIVQAETVNAQSQICRYVPNGQLEWKTEHRSAIMPYGLLLQVKNVDDSECDIDELEARAIQARQRIQKRIDDLMKTITAHEPHPPRILKDDEKCSIS